MWFSRRVLRRVGVSLPFYDPFDATHLFFGLRESLSQCDEDHLEIARGAFQSWLERETRETTGFDSDDCFDRLIRSLGRTQAERVMMTAGPDGIGYVAQSHNDQLIIDIIWRKGVPPNLTRGQYFHYRQSIQNADSITPQIIADLLKMAQKQECPDPLPSFAR